MQTVELEEAQARLPALIDGVVRGDEVLITKNDRPVAKLVPSGNGRGRPQFGSAKGKIILHPGWDEPCPDFEEYQ